MTEMIALGRGRNRSASRAGALLMAALLLLSVWSVGPGASPAAAANPVNDVGPGNCTYTAGTPQRIDGGRSVRGRGTYRCTSSTGAPMTGTVRLQWHRGIRGYVNRTSRSYSVVRPSSTFRTVNTNAIYCVGDGTYTYRSVNNLSWMAVGGALRSGTPAVSSTTRFTC